MLIKQKSPSLPRNLALRTFDKFPIAYSTKVTSLLFNSPEVLSSASDNLKKNFMAPFYEWGSTASGLEPLRGGSLLFTTKFPETPGTQKAKLFAENFLRTLILMTQVSLYLFSVLELI